MKNIRFTESTIMLVAANLVPVAGVLWWKWDVGYILINYWIENGIIGFFNVLKMISARGDKLSNNGVIRFLLSIPLILLFIVHYGGFWTIHGIFVMIMSNQYIWKNWNIRVVPWDVLRNIAPGIVSLFISHGFSFVENFLIYGERNKATAESLFMQPYSRVMVLHITIIFGAIMTIILGQPIGFLLILIGLKIAVDVFSHQKERQKFGLVKQMNAEIKREKVGKQPFGH